MSEGRVVLKKDQIYEKYLKTINGIIFTAREADIIACILHNRGEKKIASMLLISPRTVSAHVRNILMKLGYNSREFIIDFVEKSGKTDVFRDYYVNIIQKHTFESCLIKIGKLYNRNGVDCNLIDSAKDNDTILQQIKQSLVLANIAFDDNSERALSISTSDIDKAETGFYKFVFDLIQKIIKHKEVDKLIKDFQTEYTAITNSVSESNKINQQLSADPSSFKSTKEDVALKPEIDLIKNFFKRKLLASFIILVLIIPFTFYLTYKIFYFSNSKQLNPKELVLELNKISKVNNFSADNVNIEARKRNYSVIKKIEQMLEDSNKQELMEYFAKEEVLSVELLNYVHKFFVLSNHYTYDQHNGQKAREILLYIKGLMEEYISKRSAVHIDFSDLSPNELLSELSIVEDFPEIYTRVLYLLARSYIYQGEISEAKKYFELTKVLGNKLELFEGHLSERNGLELIRRDYINELVEQKQHDIAQQEISKSLQVYSKFRKNKTKKYKLCYQPENTSPQTVTLQDNIYSMIEIAERIILHYSKLISITNNHDKKEEYIKKIETEVLGSKSMQGILDQTDKLPGRKVASIYNSLGNITLRLIESDVNFDNFQNSLIQKLGLENGINKSELAKQLFNLAKSNSRNTDYTKADSYDGLIRAYKMEIDITQPSKEQIKQIYQTISDLKNKRDKINLTLNRKQYSYY